ncbi:gamma carbonic anhydrase family protein [Alteromonadaceae bacterium BrNp21-10]|nr:gamma carbonic anhydrase family protein [Alteromonadaceae bacterium BrNp21-10]
MKYAVDGRTPDIHPSTFIAPGAQIIGTVNLAENVSVWFNAVIRGDNDQITIGAGSNIQDGAILHTDEDIELEIGRGVTVGHKAMLHGCEIGEYSLIGINAVILNNAKIGRHCIIGANALVTEGMVIPDNSLVVGSPAKVIKTITADQADLLKASAKHYVENAQRYKATLTLID